MKPVSRLTFYLALFFVFMSVSSAFAMSRDIKVVADLENISGTTVGTYRALIIGINDYQDDAIPNLDTAVNDAKAMAKVLQTHYGFRPENVSLLLNDQASSRNIVKQLRQMITKANPDDSILIYYAGHGELDKVTNKGYWVPYEARGGDPSSYLSNSDIRDYIQAMKSRHILLVADSCFSGSLFGKARSLPPINDKFYASLYKEKSRWGMTSGNLTPVSDGGSGGHSIFAYHFLKKLRENENPYLTPREIYQWIAPVVANNSEQLPITKPIRNTGDEGGEFVFIRMAKLTEEPSSAGIPNTETSRPPFFPSAEESELDRILREVQEKKQEVEQVRRRAEQRNEEIESYYAKLEGVDKMEESALSSESKAKAWSGFIKKYSGSNPRQEDATKRLEHWQKMARLPVAKRKKMNLCPSKMSFIPGGVFLAGVVDSLKDMSINALCMDQYEVTQADYERVIGKNPSRFKGENRPVEVVSWHEAKAYCKKVGKRLPTEWEWEKAAKAGTTTKYYWGDDVGRNNANCDGCGSRWDDDGTAPVGSFSANPFGLHDTAGNVWEWTDSDYDAKDKVIRGGSWGHGPDVVRSAFRNMFTPSVRNFCIGFRCAK
jgi:formylglycine-generating enzyme required for sulfatase activity